MSSSDTRAALQAHKLSFRVAGRERALVEQVDLQLHPGELVGLIGPNGAGKSTLMRLLLGWLPPAAGSVSIHGRALAETGARERARQLAYMGQHSSLSFPFTAVEIVEMGSFPVLGLGRRPGRFERRQAMEALHYVELGHAAGQNFMTLSGGEQQLVLFARVLVQDSPIILLDEPTANLDLGHEAQLLRMTRELCREGRSVLAAMHNLNSAAEYCDRLILLHEGRIAAAGTPDEVLTAERIEQHYHTPVRIGTNETTGSRTVSPAPAASSGAKPRVHIIGGAGSAVTLTRHLHLLGIPVSGGVAHALDNDARLWRALDIPYIEVPAFAEIDEAACSRAAELQDQAEITVLCAFPFGPGNLGNLRLAERAKQLLILDDASGTCQRDYFAPGSRERFRQLTAHNPTLGYEQAVARLAGKDL